MYQIAFFYSLAQDPLSALYTLPFVMGGQAV